jgi:hypothetical protein
MTDKPENAQWVNEARALLDASVQELDGATVARLARARRAALFQSRRPTWANWRSWWLPLTGFAAAGAIALALGIGHLHRVSGNPGAQATSAGAADIDASASDDTIDLYQDLEFYAWLDARDDTDG